MKRFDGNEAQLPWRVVAPKSPAQTAVPVTARDHVFDLRSLDADGLRASSWTG